MSIPAEFLDALRARTSLSSLIGRTVALKKAGREFRACCPFHDEKSPSFYVNDAKGFYHCFGCQAHGDAIRWMTDHEGMQFVDAVKELAAAAGMQVPAPDPRRAARDKQRDPALEILQRAQEFFAGDLPEPARHYLEKRAIGPDLAREFGIGFAPGSRAGQPSPLARALHDIPVDRLEALGLVKRNPDTNAVYDFFRARITIPIHDPRGRVIAWGARALGDVQPKYLNSPDTLTFDKGRTLYNLHRAAPAARAKGRLFIVEGYMDVIGVTGAGIHEVVAPNGTALTEQQMALAWRLVDVPIACFDGDRGGRAAAIKAAHRALPVMKPPYSLRFAFPPEGKDPDDIARRDGTAGINALADSAVSLIEVIWRDLLERFDMSTADGKAALGAEVRTILSTIKDPDLRNAYRDDLAQRLRPRTQQPANGAQRAKERQATHGRGALVGVAVENAIMLGLLEHPAVVDMVADDLVRCKWRNGGDRLAGIMMDLAYRDDPGTPLSTADIEKAAEMAGLTPFIAWMRQNAIRMPFSAETDPERAIPLLRAALRANFS